MEIAVLLAGIAGIVLSILGAAGVIHFLLSLIGSAVGLIAAILSVIAIIQGNRKYKAALYDPAHNGQERVFAPPNTIKYKACIILGIATLLITIIYIARLV